MNNGVVLFMLNPTTGFWVLKGINQGVLSTANISSGYLAPNVSFYDFVDSQFWIPLPLFTFNVTQTTDGATVINIQKKENVTGIAVGVTFSLLFVLGLAAILIYFFYRRMKKGNRELQLSNQNILLVHMDDIKKEQEIKILTTAIHVWKGTWRHQEWYIFKKMILLFCTKYLFF